MRTQRHYQRWFSLNEAQDYIFFHLICSYHELIGSCTMLDGISKTINYTTWNSCCVSSPCVRVIPGEKIMSLKILMQPEGSVDTSKLWDLHNFSHNTPQKYDTCATLSTRDQRYGFNFLKVAIANFVAYVILQGALRNQPYTILYKIFFFFRSFLTASVLVCIAYYCVA